MICSNKYYFKLFFREMAKRVGENIDLIVGGHSHSLLWNGDPPSKEIKSGPYPEVVEAEKKPGHKVNHPLRRI